jgi:hypothetical protein
MESIWNGAAAASAQVKKICFIGPLRELYCCTSYISNYVVMTDGPVYQRIWNMYRKLYESLNSVSEITDMARVWNL